MRILGEYVTAKLYRRDFQFCSAGFSACLFCFTLSSARYDYFDLFVKIQLAMQEVVI